ncbi:M10 family metallopeptidase C-terminal domain-containing protein, partial [Photobacterium sp. Ph5]
IKATDFDNDSTSSAISITIKDGHDPVITNASSITVQEHNEKLDSAKGDLTVQVGSDNVIDYKVDIESFNKNVHITSHDQLVQLVQTSNGMYEGKVGNEVIFKYTLVSNGHYTFTMVGELDQKGTDNIKFGIPVYAIDADNDQSKVFNVEINVQDGIAVLEPESVIGNEDSKGIVIDPITVDLLDIDQGDKVDNLVIHVGDHVPGTFMLDGKVLNVIDGKIEISGDKFSTDTAKSTSKLDGLTFIPTHDYSTYNNGDKPLTFNMDVKVSTDTGPVVELSQPLNITVLGIADKPVWSSKTVDHYTINEDSTNGANLNILAEPTDKDGSEHVDWYRISLPSDVDGKVYGDIAIIKDGVIEKFIKNGSDVSASEIANVHIIPKANFSGDIKVNVQAINYESGQVVKDQGVALSDTKQLIINVLPDADEGRLSTSHIESIEDTEIALADKIHLSPSVDSDGSEHLYVQISNLPEGFTLKLNGHAVEMDNGKYEIAYDQLDHLTLSPKADISGDFHITVTGIIKDTAHITIDGKTEDRTDSIKFGEKLLDINIKGDPDAPVIEPNKGSGWESLGKDNGICTVINENGETSLNINVTSGEDHHGHAPDKSETLSVVLSDIPDGVTFKTAEGQELPLVYAGSVNGKASYQLKLSASDGESINDTLKGLIIVAPKNSTDTINMTMTTVVTEKDGKSEAFTQDINIHVVPQLAPLTSDGKEDQVIPVDWAPKQFVGDDGKIIALHGNESLAELTISGLEKGYSLFINGGNSLSVNENKEIVLTPGQFEFLLSHPDSLHLTAPHNSDKDTDTALTLKFKVAVNCGNNVTIYKDITETINVDIKAVVEDGGLDILHGNTYVLDDGKFAHDHYGEQVSNPVKSDEQGKVDLSVAWDLNGDSKDVSEDIQNAVITITPTGKDAADLIVEYNQDGKTELAMNLGNNQWLVPKDALNNLIVKALNNYTENASVTIKTDVIDNGEDNDASKPVPKEATIVLSFENNKNEATTELPQKAADIKLTDDPIKGVEDDSGLVDEKDSNKSTTFGAHLASHIDVSNVSDAANDNLSVIIKLPKEVTEGNYSGVPQIEGAYVKPGSDGSEYIVPIKLGDSPSDTSKRIQDALANVKLVTPKDYAGTFYVGVSVVNTDSVSGAEIKKEVSIPVTIDPVVDGPKDVTITTTDKEDSESVILHVNVPLTDSSETVKTVTLTLKDSQQGYFIDSQGKHLNSITVSGDDLDKIKFKPTEEHFRGEVKMTAVVDVVDKVGSNTVSKQLSFDTSVNIEPIHDDIHWDVKSTTISGPEDSVIRLSGISGKVIDSHESITSVKLEHVPDGFIVHGAVNNGNGVWTISVPKDSKSFNLEHITITPSHNFSGTADIQVIAYNQDEGTGLPHENVYSKSITIEVIPVADGVDTNIAPNISGKENSPITLDLGIHAIDNKTHLNTHGSNVHENGAESLQITITNVPDSSSFTLPDGVKGSCEKQADGSWIIKVDGSELDKLIFHPGDANNQTVIDGKVWTGDLDFDIRAVDKGIVGTDSVAVDKTIHVDVTPDNDEPVNHLPSDKLSVDEDKPLLIKGLSISDVDSHDNHAKMDMTVTLKVKDGHVSFADNVDTHGLNISYDKDHNMVINGNINTINTVLAEGVTYLGNPNFNGVDTLTMVTNDNGNAGAGGALTDTDSVDITVTPVNDAPVNTVPDAFTVDEDSSHVISGLKISDVDAKENGASGDMTVTLAVGHGQLAIITTDTQGLNITDNGDGKLVISGDINKINALLADGIKYTGDENYAGKDQLTMTTSDNGNAGAGGVLTDTDSVDITVTPVNDAPVNTVPDAFTVDEDSSHVISGLKISDVDAKENGASGGMTVTLEVGHGQLAIIATDTQGLNITDNGDDKLVISGDINKINALLVDGIKYTGDENYAGKDQLTMTTSDNGNAGAGGVLTDTDTVDITVTPVNDAPVNHVPTSITADEDVATVISGLQVSDVDFNELPNNTGMSVQLNVNHGSLKITFPENSPVKVVQNGAGNVILEGSMDDINAVLNSGVSYTGDENYSGKDELTITTNDGGNTGSGGNQDATNKVDINVTPKADAPSLTLSQEHLQTAAIRSSLGTMLPLIGLLAAASADASETLTVKLSHLGSGQVVDKDGNVIGTDLGNGNWEVPADKVDGLYIKNLDEGSYMIDVQAVSTESDSSQATSAPVRISIVVDDLSHTHNVIGQNSNVSGDNLIIDSTAAATLYGGDGDDELVGGLGSDILVGGAGDDILWGGDQGGHGDGVKDTFLWSESDFGTANAPATDKIMDFEVGIDTISLGDSLHAKDIQSLDDLQHRLNITEKDGSTLIQISNDQDQVVQNILLDGVSNNDLFGDHSSAMSNTDKLTTLFNDGSLELTKNFGDDASNDLIADSQGESLFGFDGDDNLLAGTGNDILTGGAGDDLFTWHETSLSNSNNTDTITDFELGKDKIDIRELLGNDDSGKEMDNLLKHVDARVDDKGNVNLDITTDDGKTQNIVLDNIHPAHDLGLVDGFSSVDIMNSLFDHNAFKIDSGH